MTGTDTQGAPLEILYHDEACLVVNKPAGLLTQAPPGIDSLELRVRQWLERQAADPSYVYLGIPHRLDRPCSGALVLALRVKAARRLARQFEARAIGKTYWAIVEGNVVGESGDWHDHVRKIPDLARAEIVPADHPDGRWASLSYTIRQGRPDWTWLELQLHTGRMHQIRIQAASRGFPIWGDVDYGARHEFGHHVDDPRRREIALHAREISFDHPKTRERVVCQAPLPAIWQVSFGLPIE